MDIVQKNISFDGWIAKCNAALQHSDRLQNPPLS